MSKDMQTRIGIGIALGTGVGAAIGVAIGVSLGDSLPGDRRGNRWGDRRGDRNCRGGGAWAQKWTTLPRHYRFVKTLESRMR